MLTCMLFTEDIDFFTLVLPQNIIPDLLSLFLLFLKEFITHNFFLPTFRGLFSTASYKN